MGSKRQRLASVDATRVGAPDSEKGVRHNGSRAEAAGLLLDLSLEPFFAWELDGGITQWNKGAESLYGFSADEVIGRPSHEVLATVHPCGFDAYISQLRSTGSWAGELTQTAKDGRELTVESRQQVIESNGRALVLENNRDITERKAEEQRRELLSQIGEIIRLETEPTELLRRIAVAVGTHFHAQRCLFNEIDLANDVEIVHADYSDGLPSVAGRHKVSTYSPVTSAEMSAGRTVVNADSAADPRTADRFETAYGPSGERSYVAVPLLRDGRWVASLWVSCANPRTWTTSEVGLLELVAERSWLAVERLRNEKDMRLSEERFARFMGNLPGLAWIKDLEGRYVFANDAAIGAFNAPGNRLFGRTDEEIFPADSAAEFRKNDRKVIESKKGLLTVESLEHEDGTLHWSMVSKFPIMGPDGKPVLVGGMAIDVTEQRRAEEEVRLISRMPAENPNPVMRISSDAEILYANPAARPLLDYWKRESGYELPREFRIRLFEAFRVGMRQEVEIEYDDRTIVAMIAPVAEAGYVNVYGVDITDRKRAEDALRAKEAELQLITDTTPLILTRCSRDLRYQFINQAGADVLGLPIKDIVGRTIPEVMGAEAFAVIEPYVQRVLAGELVEYETSLPYRAGPRWMRVIYVPEFAPDGAVTGWIGSITDISDVRAAQQAMARLAAIVEYSDDAIISKDTNGIITSWNNGAQRIFGYTAEETVGRSITMLMPPERVEEEPGILDRIRRGESVEHYETIRRRKDGTLLNISLTVSPIKDADGNIVGASKIARDITERKEAEERIRISQNQLRLITDGLPALISYVNREERFVYANRTYAEWFGVDPAAVVGKTTKSVFGISAYRKIKASIDEALAGREVRFEGLIPYKSGGPRYVVGTYVPDIGADGEVRGYFGLTNDITDLKRSQEMLRSSEERLGLLMETVTDYAIISMDREGRVETWNIGAEHIFGFGREEMIGRPASILFTREDIAAGVPQKELKQARLRGRASDERWHLRKGGKRFYASGVTVPLYVGKTLTGYAKITSDLTEKQRQAELLKKAHDELELRVAQRTRELAESNAALLQEIEQRAAAEKQRIDLLRRLVTSQELERRRIARDLHDQLGQRLTALRLKIASLKDIAQADTVIAARVERLQEIAERLDAEVSFLAWELRPSALDDLGLVDAIGAYVNEWSRHYEIAADFHSSAPKDGRLGRDVETHLYRIAQEALNNIAKHANAGQVSVLIERMDDDLVLIIEDDGRGFKLQEQPASTEAGHGLGLAGMRERAVLVGGGLEIETAPGKGTTIFVKVPLLN